jgi:hypothetical protein
MGPLRNVLFGALAALTTTTRIWAPVATQQSDWAGHRMFVLAPAGFYVVQWLQSFREFPPRMKPGSFNLDRVMEAVTAPPKGRN